jgi:hypothetical protein
MNENYINENGAPCTTVNGVSGPCVEASLLRAIEKSKPAQTYKQLRDLDKKTTEARLKKYLDWLTGRDPVRPFFEYPGHGITPELVLEILNRAGERDVLKKSESAELERLQTEWDTIQSAAEKWTPKGIRERWTIQFEEISKLDHGLIAQTRYLTIEELQSQAQAQRRILRDKFIKISDDATVISKRVTERIIAIAKRVFSEVEKDEKAFAHRLKFEDRPSLFRIACGQMIWMLDDSLKNMGSIPTSPNSKLNFLPIGK